VANVTDDDAIVEEQMEQGWADVEISGGGRSLLGAEIGGNVVGSARNST